MRFFQILAIIVVLCAASTLGVSQTRWSAKQATDWYSHKPWPLGSNFLPSTSGNELEMWQADTFDPATIDRELRWAEGLGMNTMRVFLHNLLWEQDSAGFLSRMESFLKIADRHHIRITFVLFDSVWNPNPMLGKQPDPRPHVHNSIWVQAPGATVLKDEPRWEKQLKPYIVGVIGHFRNDNRVLMWDLMNEPDNDNPAYKDQELPNKAGQALKLLKLEWQWAREAHPSQPLTSGVWKGDWSQDSKLSEVERFQLESSDVITFHSYDPVDAIKKQVASLTRFDRPIICTEYMARPRQSTFTSILPVLKQLNVGAYNWGFVSGRSQTIYPWDSWEKPYQTEPEVWFHDIFRKDGTPFHPSEVAFIKNISHGNQKRRQAAGR